MVTVLYRWKPATAVECFTLANIVGTSLSSSWFGLDSLFLWPSMSFSDQFEADLWWLIVSRHTACSDWEITGSHGATTIGRSSVSTESMRWTTRLQIWTFLQRSSVNCETWICTFSRVCVKFLSQFSNQFLSCDASPDLWSLTTIWTDGYEKHRCYAHSLDRRQNS